MRKQIVTGDTTEKRLLNLREASSYIGVGQTQTRRYMDEIGATRKFGTRVLFDKIVIDEALNQMRV